jgi:hypothetical protein
VWTSYRRERLALQYALNPRSEGRVMGLGEEPRRAVIIMCHAVPLTVGRVHFKLLQAFKLT